MEDNQSNMTPAGLGKDIKAETYKMEQALLKYRIDEELRIKKLLDQDKEP